MSIQLFVMELIRSSFFIWLLFCAHLSFAQNNKADFKVIPLGVLGGGDESNLSAYMIAPENSNHYACLDAGTVRFGIQQAIHDNLFKQSVATVLRTNIKGYLISHPHLDHVAGLIINSPDDTAKNIYALPFCIDVLKGNYFTWKSWSNFANEGEKPTLNKYRYIALDTAKETGIDNTELFVRPFLLSHSNPNQSTAFLVRYKEAYILYLGDTGADEIEKTDHLSLLWQHIAPLIKAKRLKAIFIETSFPDEQPVKQLFGHLTPSLLMKEMDALGGLAGKENLSHLSIVITHIKPIKGDSQEIIKKELQQLNSLKLKLVFPQQARELDL